MLDSASKTITVATDDMIFAGQKVTLTIQVDHQGQVESANSLIVVVNFSADPPTFETSELKIEPLICTNADDNWSLLLPSPANTDAGPVTIELLKES